MPCGPELGDVIRNIQFKDGYIWTEISGSWINDYGSTNIFTTMLDESQKRIKLFTDFRKATDLEQHTYNSMNYSYIFLSLGRVIIGTNSVAIMSVGENNCHL